MTKTQIFKRSESGIVLLEGLIAILIFSIGILAIVGFQAIAVKQVSDANYRSEASLLANELIGSMWVSDRTTTQLKANFDSELEGAPVVAWLNKVNQSLPGAASNPSTVHVDDDGVVTVTVLWLGPNEAAGTSPHKYVAVAQIK